MSHKDELISVAILGTEQQGLPDLLGSGDLTAKLEALKLKREKLGRERAFLHLAALVWLYEKSGQVLETYTEELPDLPAPPEYKELVSPPAKTLLRNILDARQTELLQEWLSLANKAEKRLPHDMVCLLLDAAKKDESLQEHVKEVIGERGKWLAQYNSEWAYINGLRTAQKFSTNEQTIQEQWDFGSLDERFVALKTKRKVDARAALFLLRSTWKDENSSNRARLVVALEEGLSINDEEFLENEALDDRLKEVRNKVQDLLFKIPASRLNERCTLRAVNCIAEIKEPKENIFAKLVGGRGTKRFEILVNVPDDVDKSIVRDGFVQKPVHAQLGDKAWALLQIFSMVDHRSLLAKYNLSEREWIETILGSEWKSALYKGLEASVIRFQDHGFARLLFEFGNLERPDILFGLLNSAEQEAVITRLVEERRFSLGDYGQYSGSALQLLFSTRGRWSEEFSKVILRCIRTHIMQKTTAVIWGAPMTQIGNYLNLDVWNSVADTWTTGSVDPVLTPMINNLDLRKRIGKAFQET